MARPFYAVLTAAIVLTLAWSGALLPIASAHAPTPAAVHPQAVLEITPYNQYGETDYFTPGISYGYIWFIAYNFGTGSNGTVTITDQNASRDGVPSPAGTFAITFTANENDSRGTSMFYELPPLLNFSGVWTIGLTVGSASTQTNFTVSAFGLDIESSQDAYLPGHAATENWWFERANSAPFHNVQSFQVVAWYMDAHGQYLPVPGFPHDLPVTSNGSFHWVMPLNASTSSDVELEGWANQTGTGTNFSTDDGWELPVATLSGVSISLLSCFGSCGTFPVGVPEQIEVAADVGYFYDAGHYFEQIPGGNLSVAVSFFDQSTLVAAPSGTPVALVTNASGLASFVLVPTTSQFSLSHNNSIHVRVTDPLDSATNASNSIDFYLVKTSGVARLQIVLADLSYFSGDQVTATWSLGGANASGAVGWSPSLWGAYGYSNGAYLDLGDGELSSTATSGTFSFDLPTDYQGEFDVYAYAYNASEFADGYTTAIATTPMILLNPSESTYRAGDQVNVQITPEGQVFGSATYYESSVDSDGNVLASGVVSGTSFTVPVPTASPPSDIEIQVYAETTSGGVIATATLELVYQSGYSLAAGVQTPSSYSDGSYQPGQTVTITYDLIPLGTTQAAGAVTVAVLPYANEVDLLESDQLSSSPGVLVRSESSPSGTVSFTLPSNLPNGYNTLLVLAYPTGSANNCGEYYNSCASFAQLTVNIQSNPSALNYELGSGSGLTVSWLILLILILVVALVGAIWIRRRMGGGSGGAKWKDGAKPFTQSPPAGSSATVDSGAGAPPPMPPAA